MINTIEKIADSSCLALRLHVAGDQVTNETGIFLHSMDFWLHASDFLSCGFLNGLYIGNLLKTEVLLYYS